MMGPAPGSKSSLNAVGSKSMAFGFDIKNFKITYCGSCVEE